MGDRKNHSFNLLVTNVTLDVAGRDTQAQANYPVISKHPPWLRHKYIRESRSTEILKCDLHVPLQILSTMTTSQLVLSNLTPGNEAENIFNIGEAFQRILKDEQVRAHNKSDPSCSLNHADISTSCGHSGPHRGHRKFKRLFFPCLRQACYELIHYLAGTMFELVKALNDGAEMLKQHTLNPISLNAGCELFIAFVTLFPHDSAVRSLNHSDWLECRSSSQARVLRTSNGSSFDRDSNTPLRR